jgi:hypothetical protein
MPVEMPLDKVGLRDQVIAEKEHERSTGGSDTRVPGSAGPSALLHQEPSIRDVKHLLVGSVEHDHGLESGDGLIDELVERAPQCFAPSAR